MMKKAPLLFIAVFFACLLQACHSNKNSEGDNDDTTADVIDTSKNANIVIGKDDAKFITTIAAGCLAEIKIGNLAKQKGVDKRVKNLGVIMVKDLTKGKARLIILAKAKKITLPDSLDAEDQKSIAVLAQKSGKEFDRAYLDKIEIDYKKALDLFKTNAKQAYDKDIKAFANRNLMTIQRHLDLIEAVRGSMK
ncbi:MAG: hypothetical protein JWQ79_353 [Mucilaginibacter sp.]|nr:hypothetical protein [Mucilaginibacter sp.]